MAVPYSTWSALGSQWTFWGIIDSSGYLQGTSTSAIAAGSTSPMARLRGVSTISLTLPEAPKVVANGDNGAITSFMLAPAELPTGVISTSVFDQAFATKPIGLAIETEEDYDMSGLNPACWDYARIAFIINSPANIQDSGDLDVGAWQVLIILNSTVLPMKPGELSTGSAQSYDSDLSLKRSDKQIWGKAFSTVTNGSSSFSVIQFASPKPVTAQTFIGNNATTTVTLAYTPAGTTSSQVKIWKDGVELTNPTDFTVTGSVVTFAAAPASNTKNVILWQIDDSC